MIRRAALSLLLLANARAEIIDRVAVVVGRQVITDSAIREDIRLTAFSDEAPLSLEPATRRLAAERLLDQMLLRREMELSRFKLPDESEIPALLDQFRKEYSQDPQAYSRQLAAYGVSERQLGLFLLNQAAILRFREMRFRPGVTVAEEEVAKYYRERFVPEWSKSNQAPPPGMEDKRDDIEDILAEESVNQAMDAWLRDARKQARVQFFEEAFR